jgi:hypothetical protein
VVINSQPHNKDERIASTILPPADDQTARRIYLAKQGKREGPFTLEHINAQITTGRYRDDDFWAWHDGLPEWIPLYKISGIGKPADAKTEPVSR